MTSGSSARLAIVVSHPTQYYSPWFRWLAQHTRLNIRVFYLWNFGVTEQRDPKFATTFKWDLDLLSGYESEFVPNAAKSPGPEHFRGFDNPTLTSRVAAWRPNAVLLFGYAWASHLRMIAWARLHRVPLLFRGDSHFLGRGRPSLRTRLLLGTLYAQCSAFLVVGAANLEYYTALGVPGRKLFFAPHAVNHELFDPNTPSHQEAAAALRSQLGLRPETRVVLFAGKLVPAKQPRELLEAFLRQQRPDTALVFVGDGPEKPALQAMAGAATSDHAGPSTSSAGPSTIDYRPSTSPSSGVQGPVSMVHGPAYPVHGPSVHFLPFANQSEMPGRLLLADIFALPSRGHYETWGLAVNEAMHMGVPALVSDRVGCQRDLVKPGETGWVFEAANLGSLDEQLGVALAAITRPAERERLRSNTTALVRQYTYTQTTAGLLQGLEHVLR